MPGGTIPPKVGGGAEGADRLRMEKETGILGGGAQMKITASQDTDRDKEDDQEQNRKEKKDPAAKRFMTERNKNPRH